MFSLLRNPLGDPRCQVGAYIADLSELYEVVANRTERPKGIMGPIKHFVTARNLRTEQDLEFAAGYVHTNFRFIIPEMVMPGMA